MTQIRKMTEIVVKKTDQFYDMTGPVLQFALLLNGRVGIMRGSGQSGPARSGAGLVHHCLLLPAILTDRILLFPGLWPAGRRISEDGT